MLNLDDILNNVRDTRENRVKQETQDSYKADERMLVPKIGNTYYFRLLSEPPNKEGKVNVFQSWKEYVFQSCTTDQYIYCGRALQEAVPSEAKNDLIRNAQFDAYVKAKKDGDEELKKAANTLWGKSKEVVNIYLHNVVGDDEESKAKIGTVLVYKYNATIDKDGQPRGDVYIALTEGLTGTKSKNIGKKAFDLSENGRSFCLKVMAQPMPGNKVVPKYSASFEDAEDIGVKKADEEKIRNSAHILAEFVPEVKPQVEIQKLLDEHWYGKTASPEDDVDTSTNIPAEDDDDEIPMGDETDDLDDLLKDD